MKTQKNIWKQRIFKFLLFVIIGFACAFIYRHMKRD